MVFAFEMSKHAKNRFICQSERPRPICKNQSEIFTRVGKHCEYFTHVPSYDSAAITPQNWQHVTALRLRHPAIVLLYASCALSDTPCSGSGHEE